MIRFTFLIVIVGSCCSFAAVTSPAAEMPSHEQAVKALGKAVGFFRHEVSVQGGYLWRYSADLKLREGERPAAATTAWVQPPGTPTVGGALLAAWQRTGERKLLDAARETALALVRGQLKSGGWDYRIEFDLKDRRRYAYRTDGTKSGKRNVTTLDDDTSQAALRFLMRIDRELKFKDKRIRGCVDFALNAMLKARYPNGGWPQRFSGFPDPSGFPVKKASYPKNWPRKYRGTSYRGYYTFNDNLIADMVETLFLAGEIYKGDRYRKAAEKAGDFIILAQMPDPQPAWAQQYDLEMHPAWARRFEPPSVTGGESQGILRTLLSIYRRTGKKKYLEPVPRAIAYLKRSRLKDGRLARFYELKTNRPLYFVKDTYELTYRDDNLPTHYGFQVGSKLDRIERDYKRLLRDGVPKRRRTTRERLTKSLSRQAAKIIVAMDRRGAWVERGSLRKAGRAGRIIQTRTFVKNIDVLSRFIAAIRPVK